MEHVDELIPAHALRTLDADDERQVVAHLAECDRVPQDARRTSRASPPSLAYAAPQATPPPELRDRDAGGDRAGGRGARRAVGRARANRRFCVVAARRRRSRCPCWPPCVLGLVVWNVSLRNDLDSTKASIADDRAVHVDGVGNVVADSGGNVTLYANLAPAPVGQDLRGVGDRLVRARSRPGTFEGGGTVVLDLTAQARPGDQVAITVEPAGGSTSRPPKPIGAASV